MKMIDAGQTLMPTRLHGALQSGRRHFAGLHTGLIHTHIHTCRLRWPIGMIQSQRPESYPGGVGDPGGLKAAAAGGGLDAAAKGGCLGAAFLDPAWGLGPTTPDGPAWML